MFQVQRLSVRLASHAAVLRVALFAFGLELRLSRAMQLHPAERSHQRDALPTREEYNLQQAGLAGTPHSRALLIPQNMLQNNLICAPAEPETNSFKIVHNGGTAPFQRGR